MMDRTYADKNWVFKGCMVIPGGSLVEIRAMRENFLDNTYEAGEVYAMDQKITFRIEGDASLFRLDWDTRTITGRVDHVIVEAARTLFTLSPVKDEVIE